MLEHKFNGLTFIKFDDECALQNYLRSLAGKYYTYVLWDKSLNSPHYVGQGKGYRVLNHFDSDGRTSVTQIGRAHV